MLRCDPNSIGPASLGGSSCSELYGHDDARRITCLSVPDFSYRNLNSHNLTPVLLLRLHWPETEGLRFVSKVAGYAGRAELPDNLAAFFWPVARFPRHGAWTCEASCCSADAHPEAMMVPDYALLGEIMRGSELLELLSTAETCSGHVANRRFYAYGFREAKILAKKMAGTSKRKQPSRAVTKHITSQHIPRLVSQVTTFTLSWGQAFPAVCRGEWKMQVLLMERVAVLPRCFLLLGPSWSSRVPISGPWLKSSQQLSESRCPVVELKFFNIPREVSLRLRHASSEEHR